MSSLIATQGRIQSMTAEAVGKVRELEAALRELPQIEVCTDHVFHAGTYARTICMPAGSVLTGAEIKIATLLIASGDFTVFVGDDAVRMSGYHVLPASAGRKQAFVAHEDTHLTMLFATDAKTVEQAETQFTDEAHLLSSRKSSIDKLRITGE